MIYRFADCELDIDVHELRHGGIVRAVEPQVFDLLHYLVENRNRLVARDELFENIWQSRFVSDATLSSRIKAARRAVGDTGKTQAIIQTGPRRGFRFVADVDGATSTGTAPGAAPVDVALTAPPDRPSIAVLPFASLSDDAEQQYFADGMAEDIISGLSKFGSLLVIARNSTFSYQGQAIDIRTVARELGVRYILEGSIRRSGPRIRVSVQLIDAESAEWARRASRSQNPRYWVDAMHVAALHRLGDTAGIEAAKRTLMERKPNCSLSDLDKLSAEILDALWEVALPE